jgi:hypothetical protein
MRGKITFISAIVLGLIVLVALAVPVLAADDSGVAQPARQINQVGAKVKIMVRLLLVQDETKVDTYIAKALDNGKITREQASSIKTFWTNHHKQFTQKVVLRRLLRTQDGAKVQAFLDKNVANGKVTKEQADKIMSAWNKLHKK